MAAERRKRWIRSGVWLTGSLIGTALMLGLTLATWGSVLPFWAGVVVVAGALLCGDVAERACRRLILRGSPAA